jgi:hypothetical protein
MTNRSHPAGHGRAIVTILLLLALGAIPAAAQTTPYPPGQISYQGFLVDANGVPLATNAPVNYGVIFQIYNVPSGGTPLWGELQTVTVDRGYFSVLLGQGSSIGVPFTNNLSGLFVASDASDRYIGLTVQNLAGGNVEIQPRMRLLASPYALLAGTANNAVKLQGYDWSSVFTDTGNPVSGTIPGSKIAANSLGSAQITNGAVGTAQIANGAVGTAQIANGAVGSAQMANGAVGANQLALPLYIPGSYGHYDYFCLNCQPAGVIEINNPYVSSFPYGADFALSLEAEACIYADSHSGNYCYIADSGYAAEFYGNVYVSGTLSKTAGSFKIDHPLDPANKYLSHSFVESPDMKNIYDGVATVDANGEAVVTLPDWFEALNKDFRYQLTSIGAPGPGLYIAQEVSGNRFKIAGGVRNGKVSWQVTGTRHDAYADAHRIPVEEDKPANLRGTYISPVEHQQPAEKNERLTLHQVAQKEAQKTKAN